MYYLDPKKFLTTIFVLSIFSSCSSPRKINNEIMRSGPNFIGNNSGSSTVNENNGGAGKGAEGSEVDPAAIVDSKSCKVEVSSRGELRRLSNLEIFKTLEQVLEVKLDEFEGRLPPEIASSGFNNGTVVLAASQTFIDKWNEVAKAIIVKAKKEDSLKNYPEIENCSVDQEYCGQTFIEALGQKMYRRPLLKDQVKTFGSLVAKISVGQKGENKPLKYTVLEAMMQSPQFLYRVESNYSDESKSSRKLDDFDLASRLSYFLWNEPPNEKLQQIFAAKGDDDSKLDLAVDYLLGEPNARSALRNLVRQWYGLSGLENLERDPKLFPKFNEKLVESLGEEVFRTWEDLAFSTPQQSLMSLYSSDSAWVDNTLAEHYKFNLPANSKGWTKVSKPKSSKHFGLLTMAGVLASLSASDDTSPVNRGLYFLQKSLCTEIAPSPPEAGEFDESVNLPKNPTYREMFEIHRRAPSCGACHKRIDPLGLGLERYDALGQYREVYPTGRKIDPSGVYISGEGEKSFDNIGQLSKFLSEEEKVSRCLVERTFQFATGLYRTKGIDCEIEKIHKEFATQGYSYKSLVRSIVKSTSFQNILLTK